MCESGKIDLKEIDVSLVQTFPYAGIILREVYVYDPIVPGKQLLENATVSLKFSLIPMISGNYNLQKIDVVAEKAMVKPSTYTPQIAMSVPA